MAALANIFVPFSVRRTLTVYFFSTLVLALFLCNAVEIQQTSSYEAGEEPSDVILERSTTITPHDPQRNVDIGKDFSPKDNTVDFNDNLDMQFVQGDEDSPVEGDYDSTWLLDVITSDSNSNNKNELPLEKITDSPIKEHNFDAPSHSSNDQSGDDDLLRTLSNLFNSREFENKNFRPLVDDGIAAIKKELNDEKFVSALISSWSELKNVFKNAIATLDDGIQCFSSEQAKENCLKYLLKLMTLQESFISNELLQNKGSNNDASDLNLSNDEIITSLYQNLDSPIDFNEWDRFFNQFSGELENTASEEQKTEDGISLEGLIQSFDISENKKSPLSVSENGLKPEPVSTSDGNNFEDFTYQISSCSDFSKDKTACSKMQRCQFTEVEENTGNALTKCLIAPSHMKYLVETDCKQESRGNLLAVARDVYLEGFMDLSTLTFLRNSQDPETICRAVTHSYFSIPQTDVNTSSKDETTETQEWNKMDAKKKLEHVLSIVDEM